MTVTISPASVLITTEISAESSAAAASIVNRFVTPLQDSTSASAFLAAAGLPSITVTSTPALTAIEVPQVIPAPLPSPPASPSLPPSPSEPPPSPLAPTDSSPDAVAVALTVGGGGDNLTWVVFVVLFPLLALGGGLVVRQRRIAARGADKADEYTSIFTNGLGSLERSVSNLWSRSFRRSGVSRVALRSADRSRAGVASGPQVLEDAPAEELPAAEPAAAPTAAGNRSFGRKNSSRVALRSADRQVGGSSGPQVIVDDAYAPAEEAPAPAPAPALPASEKPTARVAENVRLRRSGEVGAPRRSVGIATVAERVSRTVQERVARGLQHSNPAIPWFYKPKLSATRLVRSESEESRRS